VFLLNPQLLLNTKKQVQAGASNLGPAMAKLLRDANDALIMSPPSVVNKPATPPSGDKHDYLSLAPYYWPNPNTPNGLPYILRDGEVNPDVNHIPDSANLGKMISAVQTLSLAHYFSNDEKYATHAARLLRVWFLYESTRMNPNLKYASGVRGVNDGRAEGIIDTHDLGQVVDGIGLIEASAAWTTDDQRAMKAWFQQYLNWLLTSNNGKQESNTANNLGSWYDVQVASMALYIDNREFVTKILQDSKSKRIAKQIEPDGRQPLELKRTKSWDYSIFNLQALFELAALGDSVGVDIWDFQTSDGKGVRVALDYLIPFGLDEQKWQYQEIGTLDTEDLVPLLRQAAIAYDNPKYVDASMKMAGQNAQSGRENLLYPWANN
jgi:hypothetical protein